MGLIYLYYYPETKFICPYFKAPLTPFERVHLHLDFHTIPIRWTCVRGLGTL